MDNKIDKVEAEEIKFTEIIINSKAKICQRSIQLAVMVIKSLLQRVKIKVIYLNIMIFKDIWFVIKYKHALKAVCIYN